MFVQATHKNHYVTKQELATEKTVRPVRWLEPTLRAGDYVLRGNVGSLKLQDGLDVHYSNAEDLHDLKTETECGPRLSIAIFVEGMVDAQVGSFRIPMPRFDDQSKHWQPVATIYSQTRPERFVRYARRGVCLKKVTISISPQWLHRFTEVETEDLAKIKAFAECHLAHKTWKPSLHALGLAEQIINSPPASNFLSRLYVESRVLGLVEEAFRQICQPEGTRYPASLRPQDRQRLQAVENVLNSRPGKQPSADELAGAVGLSTNTLHRLLATAHGLPTAKYIRLYMLEKAREALERDNATIAEAAYVAGYSSPANFATAFKRCFGLSPSAVQDR